jgi:pimeloyl-ACP methyl ester carboxylesterase
MKIEDTDIEVISLNQGQSKAIIYFGGNAETLAYTALDFESRFPNHSIYMMNYPGYGNSTGIPAELDIYQAADKLFSIISSKHESVTLIGRSLGSGVATYLAANKLIEGLILITPFDSLMQVAQDKLFFLPIKYLITERFDSISRAPLILAKTLVIIAENDEVIPYQNSVKLIHAIDVTKLSSKVIAKAGHNDVSEFDDFYSEIDKFISD